MLLNIIIGFIIPWVFGVILFFINKKVLLTIFPLASMVAYTITTLEIDIGFWVLKPERYYALPAIPFCLGFYPIGTCYLIHLIDKTNVRPYILIILFTVLTTIAEWLGIFVGRVHYQREWNIVYTFFSYLLPYIMAYVYYLKVKKILR